MREKFRETRIIFSEEIRRHFRSGGYILFTVAIPILMIAAIWLVPLIQGAIAGDTATYQAQMAAILANDADSNDVISSGDTVQYTVTITNGWNNDGAGVAANDDIPAGLTYVADSLSVSGGSASYNADADRIEWLGNVASKESVTISFHAIVDAGLANGQLITNQATVRYDSNNDGLNDATQLSDSDTDEQGLQTTSFTIGGEPPEPAAMNVTDINGGTVEAGDVLLYTIVMRNTTEYDGSGMELVNDIPEDTSYVADSITVPIGSTVTSETPTLSIAGIDIPAYGEITITYRVQVDDPVPGGAIDISNRANIHYDSNGDAVNDSSFYITGTLDAQGNLITSIGSEGAGEWYESFSWGTLIVPIVFAMLLMFSIMAGVGSMVQSVSEEKENRLVELVFTSASPVSLMAGKLAALLTVGLAQAAIWIAVAAFTVPEMFEGITFSKDLVVSPGLMFTILGCFVAGYFLTTTIAIFVGAVMPSSKEASRMGPTIYMVMWVPLWFIYFILTQPDGAVSRLLSHIPFTAPIGIMVRIGTGGNMSAGEIVASLAGIVATGLVFLWLSARVFRAATLMQGKSFTPRNIWAALRNRQ